ncbi:SDR family oxidoreductase [Amycolatopsis jejuensis]|uniref:SDR family oxidoreductase n=1 Tax=Amycolatopsis jejuensis TaxID=330084 RepID=UPI0005253136|nr:SDR family oxidoreductase [Amycolatopsis jejuensis]
MRVFVTGASGHVGAAVVPELLSAGHEVIGLARSDASAAVLAERGARVRRGDLDDLDGLRAAAAEADGVIHLAFKHDAMMSGDYAGAVAADLIALQVIGEALVGTGKPLVATTGTLMLAGLDHVGTEDDVFPSGHRVDAENFVRGLADRGVRSSVVRLPPSVHSALDKHGFVPNLIRIARSTGVSAYVGDGGNRWPAGHTLDVGRIYRLALDNAPAGTVLHAVGDEGIPFRELAEAIGRLAGVPAASIAPDEAEARFGFLAPMVQVDNPTSATRTREILDWKPEHPGLLDDLAISYS